MEQGIIQGVTTTDGKVIFRTDHAVYGQEEILLHECGHLYIRGDRALKNALKDACLESMTEKELYQLSIKYGSLWQGLMSEDITDDEFLDSMLEEIYCDALAGIDRIKASGAGRLTEAVRAVFAEETGIDVDALLNGTELVAQATTKAEKSKATKEQPRNNGPPAGEEYSVDVDISTYITPEAISEAKIKVANMEPVAHLTGEEFAKKEGLRFSDQLNDFFNSFGNVLFSNRIGEVIANENSVDSDVAHGVFRKKSIAAAAIPEVLREGEIIDYQVNYDNRTYDTMCIAAPITITGERYFEGIIVRRIEGTDRFYTHDVLVEKDEAPTFTAGGIDDTNTGVRASIISLLKQVNEVNRKNAETEKTSKNIDGTNDTIYMEADESDNTRYSVDDNLEYELYEVYNGTFDAAKNEVHIGTTSNFMTDVIGAEGLELFMPAEKAYRAMKTERQAIFEGKPYGGNINYHGLGVDGLMNILNASENPIAAFVDTPSSNNKRENRIVLVTDVNTADGLGVVIEEVDTLALKNGKRIKANKSITVYPKSNVSSAIQDAIADDRILYLDEKRSQILRPGVKGANYPTAARNADFANNIRSFWENVKWKKRAATNTQPKAKQRTEAAVPGTRASGEPLSLTAPKISIVDMLNIVNEQFADVLSANVLEHFGTKRAEPLSLAAPKNRMKVPRLPALSNRGIVTLN